MLQVHVLCTRTYTITIVLHQTPKKFWGSGVHLRSRPSPFLYSAHPPANLASLVTYHLPEK